MRLADPSLRSGRTATKSRPNVVSEAEFLPLLAANLNSFALDFALRQKLQGQTINLFILEQLPVIAPEHFEQPLSALADAAAGGETNETVADFIRAEVLALTYTAHDMAPFARDMGYLNADGSVKPPFVWNTDDRAHRMARLDAVFMRLYGLTDADAEYILSTFPIVREKDIAAHGHYRTWALIRAYLHELAAGTLAHADCPAAS